MKVNNNAIPKSIDRNLSSYDKPKRRLRSKLLILASVPLLFEILFVAVLLYLQHQTEIEVKTVERAQNAIAEVNNIGKLFYDASTTVLMYGITHDINYREKYRQLSSLILPSVNKLRSLARGEVDELDALDKITVICRRGIDALDQLLSARQLGSYDSRADLLALSNSLIDQTHRVAEIETKLLQTQLPAAKRWRDLFFYWLIFGVCLSIILSIALVYAFDRRLVERLNIILDNTIKFSTGQPLNRALDGNDEISQIDQCFHAMKGSLSEARRREQSFLAMLSHDVRLPLTSATLYLQQLSRENFGKHSSQVKGRILQIAEDFVCLSQMLGNLLDIQRIEAAKLEVHPTTVSSASLVRKAFALVQGLAAQRSIDLVCHSPDRPLFADPERVLQVLVNLLTNAIKFSDNGTPIEVLIEEDNSWHQISVIDKGKGIHPDFHERIFKVYERSEEESQTMPGAGLGLAISRAIIELHNGAIGVDSELGKGSKFWFKLPIVD